VRAFCDGNFRRITVLRLKTQAEMVYPVCAVGFPIPCCMRFCLSDHGNLSRLVVDDGDHARPCPGAPWITAIFLPYPSPRVTRIPKDLAHASQCPRFSDHGRSPDHPITAMGIPPSPVNPNDPNVS